jgi:two-component system sensor histidine kinase AlgZ
VVRRCVARHGMAISQEALTTEPENDDRQNPSYLPDFCGSAAVLVVVLIAELAAIALTLARQSSWSYFFDDLAKTSLLLVWTGLSIAAICCTFRQSINRQTVIQPSVLTFLVIIAVIVGVSEAVYWVGYFYDPRVTDARLNDDPTIWFPRQHWYFLSSNVVIGGIMAGLALRYFHVVHEWHRNVENEARSRIHALQARIRPHFLFNSMNTIAALTRSNPVAAEAAVEDLADLFRASLADSKSMIRLEDELEITRVYQRMEQQRLGDRLVVEWRIDDLPESARIPSLTLQPLLENAIYHGIEPLQMPGTVEIDGYCKADMIYLSVRNPLPVNDGRYKSGNQIALDNIRERLTLAFGPRARFSKAIDQTHYEVSIAFPIVAAA